MKIRKLIFLFIVFFSLQAQKKELGYLLGGGGTIMDYDAFLLSYPGIYGFNLVSLGGRYYYTSENSITTFKVGANYDIRWLQREYLHFLRAPAGIDFHIGKKKRFFFGGGLFASYLISYNAFVNDRDFQNTLRRFQIGGFFNLGREFMISENYALTFGLQYNADFSPLYGIARTSPGGAPYEMPVTAYDLLLFICVKRPLITLAKL